MAEPTNPVVQDLTKQPLSAQVDTTQALDSEDYYYRAGDLVEIAGDEKVKKATTTGRGFGQLKTSIHKNQAPAGLDTKHRVAILTKYKYLVRMNAKGTVAAGEDVVLDTTTAGKVKKASNIAVGSGGTAVTSSAANGEILTGSVLPQEILGKCWKGGTDAEILVLV